MSDGAQTTGMLFFEVVNFSCSESKFQRGTCAHLCVFKDIFGVWGSLRAGEGVAQARRWLVPCKHLAQRWLRVRGDALATPAPSPALPVPLPL